jgi:hypothetical protein
MARHQRTNLGTYGSGTLDGSRPGDVARMRPLGQARFMHDIVEDENSEYRDREEDAAIFNHGSHDEDPCGQFNEQIGHGRLRGRAHGES